MTYTAKEIFKTLQGEGAHAGRAAVFCRFAGCNLWTGRESDRASAACTFCDTDFIGTDGDGGGKFASPELLADAIEAAWGPDTANRYIVFTGGEPLLQLDEALLAVVHARGFTVAIETNGTVQPPPGIDWICVSPKGTAPRRHRTRQRTQAGLPPGQRPAPALRTPGLRPLLPATHGRPRPPGQHRTGRSILHAAPAMAPEPADP